MRLLGGFVHTRDGKIKGAATTGAAIVLMKVRLFVFMIKVLLGSGRKLLMFI
jgi:hypothetical protein